MFSAYVNISIIKLLEVQARGMGMEKILVGSISPYAIRIRINKGTNTDIKYRMTNRKKKDLILSNVFFGQNT